MGADRKELAVQFGKNLHACRKRAGISQEEVAFLASLNQTEVSLLEQGEREPHLGTVVRLAGALHVSLEDLLRDTDWKNSGFGGRNFSFGDSGDASDR